MHRRIGVAALAAALLVGPGADALAESTPWQHHIDANAGGVVAVAGTVGESGATAGFRCRKGGEPVFLVMVRYIHSILSATRQVQWRVDGGEPRTYTWINLENGRGAGVVGPDAVVLARQVAYARDGFVVQSEGQSVEFSADGSNAAIKRAFNACGL